MAIEFDRIEVKGGNDLPITATILSMIPPNHSVFRDPAGILPSSDYIPTSGDDSVSRAAGGSVDPSGRPVGTRAPLIQKGPKAKASADRPSAIAGVDFAADSTTHTTVITANKKSLRIEDGTRITLAAQSPAL